jgi:hypothetical protein
VALRTDLLHRVITETKDAGFQEEKYESLYLKIQWKPRNIEEMLNARVQYMFQKQYTREEVCLKDIMPTNQIEQRTAIEYKIDRTLLRPREVILFVNECIERSEGSSKVKLNVIKSAEVAYSQQRLRSLYDEWRVDYPALRCYLNILKSRLPQLRFDEIRDEDLERLGFSLLNDEKTRMIRCIKLRRVVSWEMRDRLTNSAPCWCGRCTRLEPWG